MTENIDRLLPAIDDDPPAPSPSDPLLDDYLTPDIVIAEQPPPPLGRSLAVDLTADWLFVRSGAGGPIETRGVDTLRTWVTLCLSTERGSYEALPANFGMVGFSAGLGEHVSSPLLAGREDRIRDALVTHPRIDNVDYRAGYDSDGVLIEEQITVVTDDELRVTLSRKA